MQDSTKQDPAYNFSNPRQDNAIDVSKYLLIIRILSILLNKINLSAINSLVKMKNAIVSIFILISIDIFSQSVGCIFDLKTNNPIPFVNIWVENENVGTTSSINGNFYFKHNQINKYLIITSIGYEKERIKMDSGFLKVFLVPKTYAIPEVLVSPLKKKEIKIFTYRKSQIDQYNAPTTPQIFARYFPYSVDNHNLTFIKSIKIETLSKFESIINLRFFSVTQNGEPENDILSNPLIIKVKKGKRSTIISNFNNTQIQFPSDGIFIAIEYLIVEENQYEYEYFDKTLHQRSKVSGYMPMIGTIKTDTPANSWVFRKGKWEKDLGKSENDMKEESKNHFIAMELTISN